MKAQVVTTKDFRYTAEVRKLAVPAGSYSFAITSTWFGAKDPTAEQTSVQITLDVDGLMALHDVITTQLLSASDAEPQDGHSVVANTSAAPGAAA